MSGKLDHVSKSWNNKERSARNASPPRSAIGQGTVRTEAPRGLHEIVEPSSPQRERQVQADFGSAPSPLLLALEARCRGSLHRDAKHRADKQGPQPVENTNGDPHLLHLPRCSALVKPDGHVARGGRRRKIPACPRSPGTTSRRSTSAWAGSSRPRTSPKHGNPRTSCGSISASSASKARARRSRSTTRRAISWGSSSWRWGTFQRAKSR